MRDAGDECVSLVAPPASKGVTVELQSDALDRWSMRTLQSPGVSISTGG